MSTLATSGRFTIAGKLYNTADLDAISLKDLVVFQAQTAALGVPMKWSEVEQLAAEVASNNSTDGDLQENPQALMMIGVVVWASRRAAGEDLTFEEAIDFPMTDLDFLPATGDHQGPTKARKATPKGSGRAAVKRPAQAQQAMSTTPGEPSDNA